MEDAEHPIPPDVDPPAGPAEAPGDVRCGRCQEPIFAGRPVREVAPSRYQHPGQPCPPPAPYLSVLRSVDRFLEVFRP